MLVVFSPVVPCDIDHCATCKTDDNTKCDTCDSEYTADTNGVCQGNLFVYTVLLPNSTITNITVLVHSPITIIGPFRAFHVHKICIFGNLHAQLKR